MYDHTKYQMADITESFEARMLASMRRQEEEELENISPPPGHTHKADSTHSRSGEAPVPAPRTSKQKVSQPQSLYNESPYTTSDDDTSFSTWKPAVSYVYLM